MGIFRNFVDDNTFTHGDIPKLEGKLFWVGDKQRLYLERYCILLFLSTVIAAYGVLGDSTATVIGAMIIAPLMVPIVATAAALVMGDLKRAGHALLVVLGGVVGVIFVAFICGVMHTSVISFTSNLQITARVSPSLIDLIVALAAGIAGAFAISRDDVADSIPGVAISISLVPPLAVTGISLSQGRLDEASGSLLLFITNLLSILLAGGATLMLLGLSAASTDEMTQTIRRKAFAVIFFGTLLVAVPLAITSINVAQKSRLEYQARETAHEWLAQTGFDLIKLEVVRNRLELVITGSGEPPSLSEYGVNLRSNVDKETQIKLNVISTRAEQYPKQALE